MMKCDVCNKETNYNGCVYWDDKESNLCKKHYLSYCRYKPRLDLLKKEKEGIVKPQTKEWSVYCRNQEKIFLEWLRNQKRVVHKR